MLDLAILAILILGFLIGLRRGFILQLIHLTGFIAAFVIAYLYYDELAPKLKLWIPYPSLGNSSAIKMIFDGTGLDHAYYNAISFAIIFFAAKIIWQMIGSMLDFIAHLPILKQINRWAGGILGFIEVYLIMFIVLYIAALLPVEQVQGPISNSVLASAIIEKTPLLSGMVKDLWFAYIKL
ncbi:CvpA family protein [Peribacillus sp. SCS-155]|uniref:CvpA family protein n=1 Tax=Peribacillus sedimenti TaxID=3115297 RepID=UPI0039060E0F